MRGRANANFNAMNHTVDLAKVDGGAGGGGAIEARCSSSGARRLDLTVNGVRRSVDIVASGNSPAFRKTRWRIVRLDNVQLNASSTNSVAVEQATAFWQDWGQASGQGPDPQSRPAKRFYFYLSTNS